MKRFICPIDFSEAAINAMEYAANFAKYHDAKLVLFHALFVPALRSLGLSTSESTSEATRRFNNAQEKLLNYVQVVKSEYSIDCEHVIQEYSTAVDTAMAREFEQGFFDLIIMGTDKADDLEQFYFGTHTYNVINKVKSPLLMIPVECVFKPLKEVVYSTNYEPKDIRALKELLDLVKPFDPKVTVIHFTREGSARSMQTILSLKKRIERILVKEKWDYYLVTEKNAAMGLDRFMNEGGYDLLTMLTQNYDFVDRLFHRSTTRELSFVATYPILICHK